MTTQEAVQQLMEALGPTTEELAGIVRWGDNLWAVGFDDAEIIHLELDEDENRLVMTTDLGVPVDSRRLEVYQALLNYNLLWRETGGVRMGLGGDDGAAVQLYELDVRDLSLDLLRNIILNFGEKARIWRAFVAGAVNAPVAEGAQGVRV